MVVRLHDSALVINLVDETIRHCVSRTHKVITVGITLNDFQRLACVVCQNLVELLTCLQNPICMNFDILKPDPLRRPAADES